MAKMQAAEKLAPQEPQKTIPKETVKKLHTTRFQGAEFVTQEWRVMVPAGDSIQDMLHQEYWSHVSQKMKPLCIITAVWEDGSTFAEFIATDVGHNWAKVELLRVVQLGQPQITIAEGTTQPNPAPVADGFEVKFVNHHWKWCVVRLSDGEHIQTQIETEDKARALLAEHVKTVTR